MSVISLTGCDLLRETVNIIVSLYFYSGPVHQSSVLSEQFSKEKKFTYQTFLMAERAERRALLQVLVRKWS